LPRSAYLALKNPNNPLTYGADPTGVANSAPAFQQAVDQGHDVIVTCPTGMSSCKYLISDASVKNPVVITSRINLQCDPERYALQS
jgi:hypothetical protein